MAGRTEDNVLKELAEAREAYHEAANSETAPELAERSNAIKELMDELGNLLAADAEPCPDCDTPPRGRQRTPDHTNRGLFVPAVYEIYCPVCKPAAAPVPGKPDLRSETLPCAQGASPEAAAEAWNAGRRVTRVQKRAT